jgi:hypothetical protein
VWSALRNNPGRTAAGTAVATAAVVGGVLLVGPTAATPPAPPSPVADSTPVAPGRAAAIAGSPVLPRTGPLAAGPAVAEEVPVLEVPTDEGFWIGTGPGQRVWVELAGQGESPVQVRRATW